MYGLVKLTETPRPNAYLVEESDVRRVRPGARARIQRQEDQQDDWLLVEGDDEAYTVQLVEHQDGRRVFKVTGVVTEER